MRLILVLAVFGSISMLVSSAEAGERQRPRPRVYPKSESDFAIRSFKNGSQQPGGVIVGGCGIHGYRPCGQ